MSEVKIALGNFYSMASAKQRYDLREFPAQYLFGALALEEAGHDVVYVEVADGRLRRALDRVSRALRWHLGDIAVQASVLCMRDVTLFYGAAEETFVGLALLRSVGLLRRPVVCFYHNPPRLRGLQPRAARGYDLTLTLSEVARERLLELGRDPDTTAHVSWGPQTDWWAYQPPGDGYVLSCGKSARDIDTLAAALARTESEALIYAPAGWRPPVDRIRVRELHRMPPYSTTMAEMWRASVVAIPLSDTEQFYGLSELNDALAIGKPIVMTRTPHLDIDLEGIGCGIWVDPFDVEGWRSALARLQDDRDLREKMGRRAREFAEREWNDARGGEQIRAALEGLDGDRSAVRGMRRRLRP